MGKFLSGLRQTANSLGCLRAAFLRGRQDGRLGRGSRPCVAIHRQPGPLALHNRAPWHMLVTPEGQAGVPLVFVISTALAMAGVWWLASGRWLLYFLSPWTYAA